MRVRLHGPWGASTGAETRLVEVAPGARWIKLVSGAQKALLIHWTDPLGNVPGYHLAERNGETFAVDTVDGKLWIEFANSSSSTEENLLLKVSTFPEPLRDTFDPTAVLVSNLNDPHAVSGTVAVSNLPATQPVSGTVAVSNLVRSVSNFPATQVVSLTATNFPAEFLIAKATETTPTIPNNGTRTMFASDVTALTSPTKWRSLVISLGNAAHATPNFEVLWTLYNADSSKSMGVLGSYRSNKGGGGMPLVSIPIPPHDWNVSGHNAGGTTAGTFEIMAWYSTAEPFSATF